MSEPTTNGQAVPAGSGPTTDLTLQAQFRSLGLASGDVVLVHCALARLGWVCGGSVAALRALLGGLGPMGTVLVPTHTAELSEPPTWRDQPVPPAWWATTATRCPRSTPSTRHEVEVIASRVDRPPRSPARRPTCTCSLPSARSAGSKRRALADARLTLIAREGS